MNASFMWLTTGEPKKHDSAKGGGRTGGGGRRRREKQNKLTADLMKRSKYRCWEF
jgi:hypothetical protein